jgi:aspartyl-tRNA(Asn)/glutamyl-tRNA(Gln) amidotransferase subunit A
VSIEDTALIAADAARLAELYRAGDTDPVEVFTAVRARAERVDALTNAVAVFDDDTARRAAEESAQRWQRGAQLGPLDGIPVSIKDSFPMRGLQRWHGSAVHDGQPPSAIDGAPVRRLREAGAVLFAKTSMPDFGMLGAGVSSQFGIVRNPWDTAANPGGSSSGSGVLVASGAGPLSLGTDVAGSVRIPAALCGLVGLKPTQGRIAYDPPKLLGSAGPLARTVADARALLEVVGRPDATDHLSLPAGSSVPAGQGRPLSSLTFAVPPLTGHVEDEVAAAVEAQVEVLVRAGARITRLDQPIVSVDDTRLYWDVLLVRSLPELLDTREETWGTLPPELLERMLEHRDVSAVEQVRRERRLELLRARIAGVIDRFDHVLTPALPIVGWPAEQIAPDLIDGHAMHLIFTWPYNLTSAPAATVPVARSRTGLPIGVQVTGRRHEDAALLDVLEHLEASRGFDLGLAEPSPIGARA